MEEELFFAIFGLIFAIWMVVITAVIWILSKIPDLID